RERGRLPSTGGREPTDPQLPSPPMPALERLTADDLRALVLGYRDALSEHREVINRLNVYPVPDGDTGTNMALTLESVCHELDGLARTPEMLPVLADAGVVDAGGSGFLLLLDVALHLIDGRPVPEPDLELLEGDGARVMVGHGLTTADGEGDVGDLRYEVMY